MRIIAGKYRSRKIVMPKGVAVRPTKDRIREALFNILGDAVAGAKVLDVFAGSGAFGIEALSRGAQRAVFVEKEKLCVATIKDNLAALTIGQEQATVLHVDALKAFAHLEKKGAMFDLVLLDPPYHTDLSKKCLIKLDTHDILTPHCIIVLEHYKDDSVPERLNLLTNYRVVRYSDIRLSFYKRR